MELRYCSLHARVFVQKDRTWKEFSQEKIQEIQEFARTLHVVNAQPVSLDVREMPCDQCAEAIWLIFYRRPDDFHPP